MKIHESAENYLETILVLQQRNGSVRSIDIANELEFSKPSVSVAMKNLRLNGYIEVDAAGQIRLLPEGQTIAESVLEKHRMMTQFLIALGVPADVAAAADEAVVCGMDGALPGGHGRAARTL